MDNLNKYIDQQMRNQEFSAELDKSQLEYEITELLIAARNKQNMTQNELSAKSGIRQSNLSRIEQGQVLPSLYTLQRIAQGLGKRLKVSFV
jgi:predicted transcriptional regulator